MNHLSGCGSFPPGGRSRVADAQRDALAAECVRVGLWLRAIYEVGCTYGWRVSEVKGLRVRHVDLGADTIRLDPGTTKNGQGRVVTFERGPALCELLAACAQGKSADDFVFTREDGKPVPDFRNTWLKVSKAAGVPGLLFHDLRRTAARNLRRAGMAENVIMQIGGWRTRSVFDRYAIITKTTSRMQFASWRWTASTARPLQPKSPRPVTNQSRNPPMCLLGLQTSTC